MSQINPCPACAGHLGSDVPAVIAHLAGHDGAAAELAAAAISDESLLLVLHDVVNDAIRSNVLFDELPGWVQRRTYREAYQQARDQHAKIRAPSE